MELKAGYKQTEVGVIPEDWDLRKLGEISTIRDGTHQTPKYVENGIPFYSVENVTSGDFTNTKFISEVEHRFLTRSFKIEKGDILMTRIGSIGDCKLIDWDVDASFYVSLALIKVNQDISPSFISQFSKSDIFCREISLNSLQSAIPRKINLGPISNLTIIVPKLQEQQAIATALSDTDALIESLEQLIAKKRLIKQGTMQELLTGKRRLPGFSGEWEVKRLGEIAKIKTGGRNNQDKVEDGIYPFFVRSSTVERINSFSHDCEAILIPGEGGVGSIFHYIDGKFDVHQRVYAITQFTGDISGKFIYFYMAIKFGSHAMENSVKATVDSLRLPTFLDFAITMPPTLEEQTAIATVLSDLDTELTALESQLEKTRAIKQGMMQSLLTGRIRLLKVSTPC